MSIFSILDSGRSGLLAHQAAIAIASKNTANVNTDGYHKRDVVLTAHVNPSGPTVSEIRRETDSYLSLKLLASESQLGYSETQASSLESVEQVFNDGDSGLGSTIDNFFNAIRQAGTDPTDLDLRQQILNNGAALSDKFNSIGDSLSLERARADQILDGQAERINSLIGSIAEMNKSIANSPELSEQYQDRREALTYDLAKEIEITTYVDDANQLNVLFAGGPALVSGVHSGTLDSVPDPTIDGLRRIDLVSITGSRTDITSQLTNGRIGGLVQLRDTVIPEFEASLDQLAFDIATEFNSVHAAGYGTDGVTGRNFFADPGGTVSGASRTLTLEANMVDNPSWIAASTNAAEAIGGNANLTAMQTVEDLAIASGATRTVGEEVAQIIGNIGRAVESNETAFQTATLQFDQLRSIWDSQLSVSIDEELIDLTRFQRGYQASARIIETASQMFDTLLSM